MQFAFVICLMYTIGNLQTVTNTPTGLPILEVYYLATKSVAATNIFVVAILLVIVVSLFNAFASISRLTWAFARDHGLPFSSIFSNVSSRQPNPQHANFRKVHPKLRMPLNALGLIGVVCFILSLIYIGSTTAFNAIGSLNLIALHLSYVFPILFILLRKIRGPPIAYGPFKLGRWGIPVNIFSLLYLVYVIIFIPFPTMLPVTGSNMNYSGPILIIVVIGAIADWFVSGYKRFQFPVAHYIPRD
jgi:choline transport protein